MGVVQNLSGFFAARFFLGVSESGLFPGVVYYFSMWYQRRERQFRISLFFGAAALAGSFGGILAYVSPFSASPRHGFLMLTLFTQGIGHMAGVVWENGWRWIFILVSVVITLGLAAARMQFD
jgi:MFS family permease